MSKTPERITADNLKQVAGEASAKQKLQDLTSHPYRCTKCDKGFKTLTGLKSHKRAQHDKDGDEVVEQVLETPVSDTEWVTKYARRGRVTNQKVIAKLARQPRVGFIINKDQSSNDKTYLCGINGQDFEYPVETYIEFPKDIVSLIRNQAKATAAALSYKSLNRSADVAKALTLSEENE